MRPANSDVELGTKERCPYCGQFHLRPGYCQALEPGYDIDRNPCKKHVDVSAWEAELNRRRGLSVTPPAHRALQGGQNVTDVTPARNAVTLSPEEQRKAKTRERVRRYRERHKDA